MSYEFYKILHLIGLIMLFTSMGALALVPADRRKPFMALNGTAAVIMLVAGFGLLARLGLMGGMPVWAYGKLAIWIALGVTPVIMRKKPSLTRHVLFVSIILGGVAAYLAIMKPGA